MRLRGGWIFALALAACAPSVDQAVAPIAPATLGLNGPETPVVADDWWRALGDPQLDRLVAEALAGNPRLDAALARIRQAEAALATADAQLGPTVDLSGQAQEVRLSGRSTIPPPFAGSTRFLGTVQANLNWNLDLFGRQRAAIEGARATTRAARLDLEAARLALAGAVVQTYAELARAERQAAIAERTVATRAESLRLVQVRIRNRLASELEARGSETTLAQARAAVERATRARRLALNALAALIERGPEATAGLAPTRLRLDAPLPLPATLPADLLARRPDVAAALARIEAARASKEAARLAYYPNINLLGLAGFTGVGIGNVLTPEAGTIGAGAALGLPIFDNGRRRADLGRAAGVLDLAIADYNDEVVGAVREAADAITRVSGLDAERRRQAEVVRGFSETARLNNVRVASGLESKLGLVETDIRQLEAEQALANLAVDEALARVALVLALGGGFAPVEEASR